MRLQPANVGWIGRLPQPVDERPGAGALRIAVDQDQGGIVAREATGLRKASGKQVEVSAGEKKFKATVRIDTPQEVLYYQHGGILQYVLRQLLAQK